MSKQQNIDKVGNMLLITLEDVYNPIFLPDRTGDFIRYGEDNDIPNYLIHLADNHAEHNAILSGKVNYIAGGGVKYDKAIAADQEALYDKWIASANRYEDWHSITRKITTDLEYFNGYYLQIIWGANGKPAEVYHIPHADVRIHKDMQHVLVSKDWQYWRRQEFEPVKMPIYNPGIRTGTCVFVYKVDSPACDGFGNIYPKPDYKGAIKDIDTDVEISNHHNSNVRNGMSANSIVNIYGTEPTDDEKRVLAKRFKSNHTGSNNSGKAIFNFAPENGKGADVQMLETTEGFRQFEAIQPRNETKIFTGHKVTNKAIFGIATQGTLGQRKELLEAFELFTKTYVEIRRVHVENTVRMFAKMAGLVYTAVYVEGNKPIGAEITISDKVIDEALTIEEKRELIKKQTGIELSAEVEKDSRLSTAQKLGAGSTQALLEFLQSTAITDPQQKKNILMALFGLSKKKAEMMLNIQPGIVQQPAQPPANTAMSSQERTILQAFLEKGHPANEEDEEVEVRLVDFDSDEACRKFETAMRVQFAEEVIGGSVTKVRNAILDLLAGDPAIKPDIIAKQLGLEESYVREQINWLIDKKIIIESEGGFTPTEKGLNKAEDVEPVVETEIYTEYSYGLRADVKGGLIIDTTRDFCREIALASQGGKRWTREDIDDISNEFEDNAWVYRGGFYNDGKETTPYCRHIWKAHVRKKRVKK